MPELPEVETIRRQLASEIKGYTFTGVATDAEGIFKPSFKVVSTAIKNKKIESIERQAKLLIFNLSSGVSLLFHLKLTGRLLIRSPGEPPDDYTHAVFAVATGTARPGLAVDKELRFADARKFGFVKLITDKSEMESLLKSYGPEPLKDLTLPKFKKVLSSSSRPVKIVLLDQEKISGIGNIYANDALWLAGVEPRYKTNKITSTKVTELYKAILVVLKRGLEYGGASDQWYRQVHGEEGEYQKHFLVYGRSGEKCQKCGDIIKRIVVGGRGTFVCPTCQK